MAHLYCHDMLPAIVVGVEVESVRLGICLGHRTEDFNMVIGFLAVTRNAIPLSLLAHSADSIVTLIRLGVPMLASALLET